MKQNDGLSTDTVEDPTVLCDLARLVHALFDRWGISAEHQVALLGMAPLELLAAGTARPASAPSADALEAVTRARELLAIHRALHLLFPENADLRFSWVHRRNEALGGSTPIAVMLDRGSGGRSQVLTLLEHQCSV